MQILLRHGVTDNIGPHAVADRKRVLRSNAEPLQGDGDIQRAAANIHSLLLQFDITPAPGQSVGVSNHVDDRRAEHRYGRVA